jgi:hypothetical protein
MVGQMTARDRAIEALGQFQTPPPVLVEIGMNPHPYIVDVVAAALGIWFTDDGDIDAPKVYWCESEWTTPDANWPIARQEGYCAILGHDEECGGWRYLIRVPE